MKPLRAVHGTIAPLLTPNIDTEVIIRVVRLMEFKRGELGRFLFEPLRYLADGSENPQFILNQHGFRHSTILLAGENFGCGSSREAAVWALMDFGIQCVIAASFGDIFAANCLQNGLLPLKLDAKLIGRLAQQCGAGERPATVDLAASLITTPAGEAIQFELPQASRTRLLYGRDSIDETLPLEDLISSYQARARVATPWLFPDNQLHLAEK